MAVGAVVELGRTGTDVGPTALVGDFVGVRVGVRVAVRVAVAEPGK